MKRLQHFEECHQNVGKLLTEFRFSSFFFVFNTLLLTLNIFHINFSTRVDAHTKAWKRAYVTVLARTRHPRVFGLSTR